MAYLNDNLLRNLAAGCIAREGEGEGGDEATCALVRSLFHRNHNEEPLFPTTNRSLPGAHLSASLHAHVGAMAKAGLSGRAVHDALRRAVCSERGVTLSEVAKEVSHKRPVQQKLPLPHPALAC